MNHNLHFVRRCRSVGILIQGVDMMRLTIMLITLASFFIAPPADAGKPKIKIDILHPSGGAPDNKNNNANVSIQNFSGWPLTIRFTMKNELGIASGPAGFFPINQAFGFVVFDDPDDCLVFDGYEWGVGDPFPAGSGCPLDGDNLPIATPLDETYFEFSVDTDAAGVPDDVGNPDRQTFLASSASGQPLLDSVDVGLKPIGPPTGAPDPMSPGDEIVDGYGYGADDDLPGVVILARHGPGIVYDVNGFAVAPLALRNLAGFINAVSYELSSANHKTTVIAHMNVPSLLVAPVVVADDNYVNDGDPSTLDTDVLWRIDGATEIVQAEDVLGESPFIGTFNSYPSLIDEFRYQVSVMAVSGIAPDVVVDENNDGQIDETDLEAMGYTVLGKMESVSFDLFPAAACFGGTGNFVFADLNNDGNTEHVAVCPTGPGSVSKPPR